MSTTVTIQGRKFIEAQNGYLRNEYGTRFDYRAGKLYQEVVPGSWLLIRQPELRQPKFDDRLLEQVEGGKYEF